MSMTTTLSADRPSPVPIADSDRDQRGPLLVTWPAEEATYGWGLGRLATSTPGLVAADELCPVSECPHGEAS